MYFRKFGHQSGHNNKALVILHGLLGSGRNWRGIAETLSKNIPVYTVDLPNHGETAKQSGAEDMTWSMLSERLDKFLGTLPHEKVALMGHSFGGQVVMQAKFHGNPQIDRLVEKLLIVDISPKPLNFSDGHIFKLINKLIELQDAQISSRHQATSFLSKFEPNPAVVNFLLSNAAFDKTSGGVLKFNIPLLKIRESMLFLQDTYDEVNKHPIETPTWFIKGEGSDFIRLPEDQILINSLFPNSQIKVIDGAGHWPHYDQSENFTKTVQEILLD